MGTEQRSSIDISKALATEGWMEETELVWLAEHAIGKKTIVELGSYLGRSTLALAQNTEGVVYALDDWRGPRDLTEGVQSWRAINNPVQSELRAKFESNVLGQWNIIPIECDHDSPPPISRPADLIFIDGSHEFADVRRDILYWRHHLAPNGILCGHDYNWDGVYQAVGELLPYAKSVPGTSLWYWENGHIEKLSIKDYAERTGLRLPGAPAAAANVESHLPPWQTNGAVPKNLAVAIGLPCSGRYVPFEMGIALAGLAFPPSTNWTMLPVKGVKRDVAREGIAEKAIELGARNLLFIDDDNPPPPDTIYKLLQAMDSADDDVAVVAGIYCTKTNPPSPLVFQAEGGGPYWRWKRGDIFDCESIATGCMMIRTAALAKIPKPWFKDVTSPSEAKQLGLLDADSQAIHFEMTDDIYFCRKVRAAGFRILAHGGVLPGHWDQNGNVYFLPDDSYPMRPRDR